jgi:hypothetical protein
MRHLERGIGLHEGVEIRARHSDGHRFRDTCRMPCENGGRPGPGGNAKRKNRQTVDGIVLHDRSELVYWWIPDRLTHGDQGAFAAALAPRPLMLWAPESDIGMPKAGVDQFIATVRPAYARAGAEKNFVVHQPPGEHEFTLAAFDAMADFFRTALAR